MNFTAKATEKILTFIPCHEKHSPSGGNVPVFIAAFKFFLPKEYRTAFYGKMFKQEFWTNQTDFLLLKTSEKSDLTESENFKPTRAIAQNKTEKKEQLWNARTCLLRAKKPKMYWNWDRPNSTKIQPNTRPQREVVITANMRYWGLLFRLNFNMSKLVFWKIHHR